MNQPPNQGGWGGPQGPGQPWNPGQGQPFPMPGQQYPQDPQQSPQSQQFPPNQQFPQGQQWLPSEPFFHDEPPQNNQEQYGPPPGYGPPQGPGYGPPSGGPPWGPPGKPARAPWWRRGWVIGPIIVGVVAIVAIATTVSLLAFSDDSGSDPSGTVEAYLQALSDGDAKKALAQISAPGNTKLLTDDIVKRQQAKAKIGDIKVVDDTDLGELATVKATYNFGQRNADVDFRLTKKDGDWKIEQGAIEIDLSLGSIQKNKPTLFGVDVSSDSKAYVFPGPLEWGTSNKYITANDEKADDWSVGPDYGYFPRLDFAISKEGNTAASIAVSAYLEYCSQSKQTDASVDKPGCDQRLFAFDAIPGTVTWSDPRTMELSSIKLDYVDYSDDNGIRVSGSVPWQATYRSNRTPAPVTVPSSEYLSGTVDLSASPPRFQPN